MSESDDIKKVMSILGKRGGAKTRKRKEIDPEYYKKIGKLGAEKRWKR